MKHAEVSKAAFPVSGLRGRLFPITPLGIESGSAESLTSYIARLSQAHCLPPGILVMQELVPFFKRRSITDGRGQCDLFFKVGASLNGVAGAAAEAVDLLQHLTKQHSLDRLTLLPLKGAISPRSSIRLRKAWCPRCFRAWSQKGEPYRELLAWQVNTVRVCPVHPIQKLQQECPHCHQPQYPLMRYSRPGFCCFCGGWLGALGDNAASITPTEKHIAEEVRALLTATGRGGWAPNVPAFRKNLNHILRQLFHGSLSALGRAAGLHHSSVSDILRGTAKPGFNTLLQISIAAGIPVVRMLEKPLELSQPQAEDAAFRFPRKQCHHYDWPNLARELARLNEAAAALSSLNRFCKARGCDPGYVAKRLPSAARPVILKFRRITADHHMARLDREEAEMRGAVTAWLRVGQWPSFRRIRRKLVKPGLLRNPQLIKIRKQMLIHFFENRGTAAGGSLTRTEG